MTTVPLAMPAHHGVSTIDLVTSDHDTMTSGRAMTTDLVMIANEIRATGGNGARQGGETIAESEKGTTETAMTATRATGTVAEIEAPLAEGKTAERGIATPVTETAINRS
jgi:hypothetical protein